MVECLCQPVIVFPEKWTGTVFFRCTRASASTPSVVVTLNITVLPVLQLTNIATGTAVVEKMYDVRGKRCQAEGCIRQPGFGHPVRHPTLYLPGHPLKNRRRGSRQDKTRQDIHVPLSRGIRSDIFTWPTRCINRQLEAERSSSSCLLPSAQDRCDAPPPSNAAKHIPTVEQLKTKTMLLFASIQ